MVTQRLALLLHGARNLGSIPPFGDCSYGFCQVIRFPPTFQKDTLGGKDELKKLYAQLEVHKTKKMTANNPHLQKKRSSRRALGRSIIKRITEIPESMSRQCSRDGSIAGSSYAGSYRKKLHDSASSSLKVKQDSIKHRVFSIRKSHSTYDHVREQRDGHISRADSSRDPSLLDSLMRKKLAKKVSEASDGDSLDDAPLVCKSASAHNLTVDMN
eukprot:g38639.t1